MKNGKAEDDTKVLTSSSDVKACPFPFNCFNKLTQVSNDATGVSARCSSYHIWLSNIIVVGNARYCAMHVLLVSFF